MIWDIAAVIGFSLLCLFAYIGLSFTIRAWVFATQLAYQKFKHDKIKEDTSETVMKIILTEAERDAAEEFLKQQKKNKE